MAPRSTGIWMASEVREQRSCPSIRLFVQQAAERRCIAEWWLVAHSRRCAIAVCPGLCGIYARLCARPRIARRQRRRGAGLGALGRDAARDPGMQRPESTETKGSTISSATIRIGRTAFCR
eukprot:3503020-Prymnesium_polylepis.2